MRQEKRKEYLFLRYNGQMIKLPIIPSPLFVFPSLYFAKKTPGPAKRTSYPILKSFHVVVLTVSALQLLLLPSFAALHEHKT